MNVRLESSLDRERHGNNTWTVTSRDWVKNDQIPTVLSIETTSDGSVMFYRVINHADNVVINNIKATNSHF